MHNNNENILDNKLKKAFLFIFKIIQEFYWSITVMFLAAIIWSIDLSLRPYILKIILNVISNSSGTPIIDSLIWPVTAYFMMTFLVSTIYRLYGYYVELKMIPKMRKRIGDSVLTYLLNHSYTYYQNNLAGSLVNKINDLVNCIPILIQIIIDKFFSFALAIIIAIYTLSKINIEFGIAMLLWSGVFTLGCVIYSKKLRDLSNIWSELHSVHTGKVVDVLFNILSVKFFARRKNEEKFLSTKFQEVVAAEEKFKLANFWFWIIYGYSFVLMQGISLYFLIVGFEQDKISVGDFALVLSINIAIVGFLWQLTSDISEFSKNLGKIIQALSIINHPIEILDRKAAKPLIISRGEIVFDNVQFHYNDRKLFENIEIVIKPGQKVGLVGYSGSGKSTFVNLILRLHKLNSGKILIDNQDICEVSQLSLHSNIAIVPSESHLFYRSLLENIRYGNLSATNKEVAEAAKLTYAHDFITTLPQGYQSLVGTQGTMLSGGQKQRILLARAILKNSPIMILDEATSQLDSITENKIMSNLSNYFAHKTVIMIAHRLSTLANMDRILVFDQGKIIEDGTHNELLNKDGLYKSLWKMK